MLSHGIFFEKFSLNKRGSASGAGGGLRYIGSYFMQKLSRNPITLNIKSFHIIDNIRDSKALPGANDVTKTCKERRNSGRVETI